MYFFKQRPFTESVAADPTPKKVKSSFKLMFKRGPSQSKELLQYKVFKAPLHVVIANDQLPEIIQVSG